MKLIIIPTLVLGALASVAQAEPVSLNNSNLDQITAGFSATTLAATTISATTLAATTVKATTLAATTVKATTLAATTLAATTVRATTLGATTYGGIVVLK